MKPDLSAALAALTAVLERENAALAALDLPGAAALLSEKRAAAASLDVAAASPAGGRPQPQAIMILRLLATENRQLLERAIAVQGRVIAVVARAIPRATPQAGYGASGGRSVSGRPMAMALSARA